MTREETIAILENEKKCVNRANKNDYCNRDCYNCELVKTDTEILNALDMAIKALEQEPCEMTAEEYRQRMIQAFHNADTDELIAVCVLPTEKEFEHLEWLLKNHYKKEPCEDAVNRKAVHDMLENLPVTVENHWYNWLQKACIRLAELPPVTPQPKTGHWIEHKHNGIAYIECSECSYWFLRFHLVRNSYCPNCGTKMEVSE